MNCEHGRTVTTCLDCARETLIGGAPDIATAVTQTLNVELACRSNYIAWLERRVRTLEAEIARMDGAVSDLSEHLAATWEAAA